MADCRGGSRKKNLKGGGGGGYHLALPKAQSVHRGT